MLKRYDFKDSRSAYTPALANTLLSSRDCPAPGPEGDADREFMKDKPYRQCIGDLLWISRVYRYDLQFAVNMCARVANNPGPKHWQALCKILRYLNHTRDYQLVYGNPTTSDVQTVIGRQIWNLFRQLQIHVRLHHFTQQTRFSVEIKTARWRSTIQHRS